MNIGIDSLAFFRDKNRGIGLLSLNQIKNIIKNDKINQYYFLNLVRGFEIKKIINSPNFHEINHYLGSSETIKNNNSFYGTIVSKFIDEYKIKIFYIPSAFNGVINKYERSWFNNAKIIVMLHDAIPYLFPRIYFHNKKEKEDYLDIVDSIKNFDAFFANSVTTKSDYVNELNFDPSKIFVVYASPADNNRKHNIDLQTKRLILDKYKITSNYILSVSGDDLRKNNENLIKSYVLLPNDLKKSFQLVIVCSFSLNTLSKLSKLINSNHLKDRIILTNYVNDSTLDVLYNCASVFAFPSLYEGFGLPLIEAYNHDLPTLTSNNSSLGEIGHSASILVNPKSVESIYTGLLKLLDASNWNKMIEAGRKTASLFSWENISKNMIGVFSKLSYEDKEHNKKKRYAIFCPLPPIKSGISDFSVGLINALSTNNFIDVFVDNYTPKISFNSNVKIFNSRLFNSSSYDKILFEMGCSEYHVYMIPFILKYKGIVELHDCYYSALLDYIHKKDKILFNKILGTIASNGNQAPNLHEIKQRYNTSDYLFKFLVNFGCSFIVHNDYAKEKILREKIVKVIKIPLAAYYDLNKIDKNIAREKLKLSNNDLIFSSFGFITRTKRALELIRAFELFLTNNKAVDAKMIFVGSIDSSIEPIVNSEIKKFHLSDKVLITNFVNRNTYNLFLSAIDLNFNLRSIYNGESSAVLSDLSYLGIPNVIEKIGVFDEIPDEYAKKINHYNSDLIIKDIYDLMNDFYHNKNQYANFFGDAIPFYKSQFDFAFLKGRYNCFLENKCKIFFDYQSLKHISKNERGNSVDIAKSLAWCLKF